MIRNKLFLIIEENKIIDNPKPEKKINISKKKKGKINMKKHTNNKNFQLIDEDMTIHISNYKITYEPLQNKKLPQEIKDKVAILLNKARKNPKKAIPELEELKKKYPQVPLIYNYLTVAYTKLGKTEKADEIIKQNIQKNPDYLFARLNYAETCLAKKKYDKVAEIFDWKFDLKMLYPKRKQFHISEIANFMGIIGIYFYEIGEQEAAKKHYEILQKIAPRYPMTKRLKRMLKPNILIRLLQRLINTLEIEEIE